MRGAGDRCVDPDDADPGGDQCEDAGVAEGRGDADPDDGADGVYCQWIEYPLSRVDE